MFTTDGRQLVVGGEDGVTVRDAATLSVLKRFPARRPRRTVPTAYALSGDDRTVAIGGEDGSLRLLDLTTGKLHTASGRHHAAVNEALFTPDRRTLVTTARTVTSSSGTSAKPRRPRRSPDTRAAPSRRRSPTTARRSTPPASTAPC